MELSISPKSLFLTGYKNPQWIDPNNRCQHLMAVFHSILGLQNHFGSKLKIKTSGQWDSLGLNYNSFHVRGVRREYLYCRCLIKQNSLFDILFGDNHLYVP